MTTQNIATDASQKRFLTAQAEQNFEELCEQYEISTFYREDLGGLIRFEISIVIDDSGSMTLNNGSGMSRWDELKSVIKIIINLAGCLDADGIDIYFLNREIDPDLLLEHQRNALAGILDKFGNLNKRVVPKVRTYEDIEWAFQQKPRGYTPLEETIAPLLVMGGKPGLILVPTDGMPTDRQGNVLRAEFEKSLKNRDVSKSCIGILACSNREEDIGYLNGMDKRVKFLDVIDDYASERVDVLKKQKSGFRYSLGDHVARLLLGPTNDKYDKQDEKRVVQMTAENPNAEGGCCIVS